MDKELKKLIEASKKINLSAEEKSNIKQSILNFIENNPVRLNPEQRLVYQSRLFSRDWSSIFLTKLNFSSVMAILLILTVMVGGGVAFGAEKSLPGDVLYPMKIGVNEEVRGWLSASEEGKADWEVQRVQRRLEEAETLAADGSLSADARAKIEANFESHADKVKDRIEKFEGKENFNAAVGVSSRFEASLKAHQKILNRLSIETEDEDVKKEVKPIETRVRSRVRALTKAREQIELRAGSNLDVQFMGNDQEDEGEDDIEIEDEAELELNLDNNKIRSEGRLKANLGL